MERNYIIYNGKEIIEQGKSDVNWDRIRKERDKELKATDWWALKDLTMTQAKKDYRAFLRDLPQNYDTANDAADAWAAYDKPE